MISIYRYINGIGLNGKEYLLDKDNQVLVFPNETEAFTFLYDAGVKVANEEELEEEGIHFERKESQ
tara:strand:- start:1087 stop:1284 length:198 start_codon:yes stop_codon:yes gene_type:complete